MRRKNMLLIILVLSIMLNLCLAYSLYRSERYGHYIEYVLYKLGIAQMDDRNQPDYWTLEGWTNSVSKQHTQYDVAFIGNSLTYNSDFQSYFPEIKIINLGVSGNTLKDMQRRIPTLVAANPRKVFVMAGANDLLVSSIDKYIEDYKQFLKAVKNALPNTEIYVQSMLPMNSMAKNKQIPSSTIIEANKRVKDLANAEGCTYVDLYSVYAVNNELPGQYSLDGLHLKESAYSIWAKAIENIIK